MIVELKNPSAVFDTRLAAHLREGFFSVARTDYGDFGALLMSLAEEVRSGAAGLLFDVEGASLLGFTLLDATRSPWRQSGWVMHFYAKAPAARRRLVQGAVDWFRSRGVYRVRAINGSGASDAGFVRMFATAGGWRGSVVGSVVEMEDAHGGRRQQQVQNA